MVMFGNAFITNVFHDAIERKDTDLVCDILESQKATDNDGVVLVDKQQAMKAALAEHEAKLLAEINANTEMVAKLTEGLLTVNDSMLANGQAL